MIIFQAAVVSILLCGCSKWTLTKHIEKKLDRNCTRMLWAILNKSWKQPPTKQQLYDHLPPISKTIQIRWTRHSGHYCRSKDKLRSDILLWTLSHRYASVGRLRRTYLQQLCMDTRCRLEDLPNAMDDRDEVCLCIYCMSFSLCFDDLQNRRWIFIQLLFSRELLPGFIQN